MDPISLTASVIAIATLAAQSAKAAYNIIDDLVDAPQAIADSRTTLQGTQNTLNVLNETLEKYKAQGSRLESVLKLLAFDKTLSSTEELCVNFSNKINNYTRRSTDTRFSNRDRILVTFHESKITKFNEQLSDCQQTVSLMIGTTTLILSSDIFDNVQKLSGRFEDQEKALSAMITKFSGLPTPLGASEPRALDHETGEDTAEEERATLQRTAVLRDACQAALKATKAKRTGQTFGNLHADQSMAMQGIVGEAQNGVDQSFGNLTAQNHSRAFQGQMDASSFARMFN